jgi:rod shape-determining protein MreD
VSWFLPGLFACAVIQTVLLHAATVGGIRPDLFLLLVFLISLRSGADAATLVGLLAGLYQDALSGAPLGLRAFTYSLLGFLVSRLSRDLYTEKPLTQFWLLLVGSTAAGCVTFALLMFFLGPRALVPALAFVILPEALYTAAFGVLVLQLPMVRAAITRDARAVRAG